MKSTTTASVSSLWSLQVTARETVPAASPRAVKRTESCAQRSSGLPSGLRAGPGALGAYVVAYAGLRDISGATITLTIAGRRVTKNLGR